MNWRRLFGSALGRTEDELDPDRVPLRRMDYRRTRTFLAPHVFAIGGDVPDPDPTELMDAERWRHVMHLPDDVALRSSAYSGDSASRTSELAYAWLRALPDDPNGAPFMFDVALGAHEEFEAVTFIALHGFYRQALGSLRNAVELLTHAAALAVEQDEARYRSWRTATVELRFRDSRQALERATATLEGLVRPAAVFADQPTAWTRRLYKRLCGYAHSEAGKDNAAFWESNGPVYRHVLHRQVEQELREVVAYCSLCMRLGWPEFKLGGELRQTLEHPGDDWRDIAAGTLAFIELR
jgi:hypothetical protein